MQWFILNAAPPSHPDNLCVTGIHKDLYYATINLQWDPPLENNNHYVISVYFSSSDVWKTATEATTAALNVPYNVNFTVTAVAVNCAGSGDSARLDTLKIGNNIYYQTDQQLF